MSDPIEGKPTRTSFVYDAETGEVIHVHQFVPWKEGDTGDVDQVREMALAQARASRGKDLRLETLDLDGDYYSGDVRYRVELKSRELVREPVGDLDEAGRLDPGGLEAQQRHD
jgi:hypothetical protein